MASSSKIRVIFDAQSRPEANADGNNPINNDKPN
jgi:hypothetical protein